MATYYVDLDLAVGSPLGTGLEGDPFNWDAFYALAGNGGSGSVVDSYYLKGISSITAISQLVYYQYLLEWLPGNPFRIRSTADFYFASGHASPLIQSIVFSTTGTLFLYPNSIIYNSFLDVATFRPAAGVTNLYNTSISASNWVSSGGPTISLDSCILDFSNTTITDGGGTSLQISNSRSTIVQAEFVSKTTFTDGGGNIYTFPGGSFPAWNEANLTYFNPEPSWGLGVKGTWATTMKYYDISNDSGGNGTQAVPYSWAEFLASLGALSATHTLRLQGTRTATITYQATSVAYILDAWDTLPVIPWRLNLSGSSLNLSSTAVHNGMIFSSYLNFSPDITKVHTNMYLESSYSGAWVDFQNTLRCTICHLSNPSVFLGIHTLGVFRTLVPTQLVINCYANPSQTVNCACDSTSAAAFIGTWTHTNLKENATILPLPLFAETDLTKFDLISGFGVGHPLGWAFSGAKTYHVNSAGSGTIPFQSITSGAKYLSQLFSYTTPNPDDDVIVSGTIDELTTSDSFSFNIYGDLKGITNSPKPSILVKGSRLLTLHSFSSVADLHFIRNSVGRPMLYVKDFTTNATIERNIFEYSATPGTGVHIMINSHNNRCENNLFLNVTNAIMFGRLYSFGGGVHPSANTVVNNTIIMPYGVAILGKVTCDGSQIVNNIIFCTGDSAHSVGILSEVGTRTTGEIDYNCIYGVSQDYVGSVVTPGSHSLSTDPLFNTNDYSLQASSPCISTGIGWGVRNCVPFEDIVGVSRGAVVTAMGIHESVAPATSSIGLSKITLVGNYIESSFAPALLNLGSSITNGKILSCYCAGSILRGISGGGTGYVSGSYFAQPRVLVNSTEANPASADFSLITNAGYALNIVPDISTLAVLGTNWFVSALSNDALGHDRASSDNAADAGAIERNFFAPTQIVYCDFGSTIGGQAGSFGSPFTWSDLIQFFGGLSGEQNALEQELTINCSGTNRSRLSLIIPKMFMGPYGKLMLQPRDDISEINLPQCIVNEPLSGSVFVVNGGYSVDIFFDRIATRVLTTSGAQIIKLTSADRLSTITFKQGIFARSPT